MPIVTFGPTTQFCPNEQFDPMIEPDKIWEKCQILVLLLIETLSSTIAVSWAKKAEKLGAGEILLTSIDRDGTKMGFDIELTKAVSEAVNIPVIASGGAGKLNHFLEGFKEANADAALAASLFHYRELTIREVKEYLSRRGVNVRLDY